MPIHGLNDPYNTRSLLPLRDASKMDDVGKSGAWLAMQNPGCPDRWAVTMQRALLVVFSPSLPIPIRIPVPISPGLTPITRPRRRQARSVWVAVLRRILLLLWMQVPVVVMRVLVWVVRGAAGRWQDFAYGPGRDNGRSV
ncbi:hypothetical protein B0H13DRAFT_2326972 [Mycena leptocephala]|nr:hypothetical protein B0H13DRAFT_2326972 [Mycena leptocephala]